MLSLQPCQGPEYFVAQGVQESRQKQYKASWKTEDGERETTELSLIP